MLICSPSSFLRMARSSGARPKCQSKKAYDPEFLYDFPPSSLFHEDFDLEEKGDMLQPVQSAKQSKTTKTKRATVPAASPPPISPEDSASSLTYDQQLQLIQLQKEKLELELKVLSLSHRERPQDLTLEGFTEEVNEPAAQRRVKRSIDWPHDFVPSIQGEYDKLNLPEFVSGFLIMMKTYDAKLKEAFLAHLELLMIKAISYSWSSVHAFHKFVSKQVEQQRLEWHDTKAINNQASTFFCHSDLRSSSPYENSHNNSWPSSSITAPNNQQAVKPGTGSNVKACKSWNYTATCDCDKQESAAYSEHHRCRVCKADHPMLHCPKRRTPIPAQ